MSKIKDLGFGTHRTLMGILVALENGERPVATLRDFRKWLIHDLRRSHGFSRDEAKERADEYIVEITADFRTLAEEELAA